MCTPLVNLNDALTSFLSSGDSLMEVEKVIAYSLNIDHAVNEIIRTKRYDTLPLFLPLLPLDNEGICDKRFAQIYAQAMLDDDFETRKQLDCLREHIDFRKVCFWYGALMVVPKDMEQIKREVSSWNHYLHGLVSADNLELFLSSINVGYNTPIRERVSKYCAKRIMDHFGYAPRDLNIYVNVAVARNNKQTMAHLFERVEVSLCDAIARYLCYGRCEPAFARWLLEEKYYRPTEEDWKKLENEREELYTALQDEV